MSLDLNINLDKNTKIRFIIVIFQLFLFSTQAGEIHFLT